MDLQSTTILRTGRAMPVIGLGTWKLTQDTSDVIAQAIQAGYRMIDTSGDYGTQPGVGEGLRQCGVDREALYVVTKVEEDEDAYKATRKNLAELGLEYADLMLIHRPPENGVGEALWDGLLRARQEGLAKDIGVSNYSVRQIQALAKDSGELPAVNQIEWTPFGHSEDMFAYCQEHDIVIQAYSPLTRGKRLDNEALAEIAAAHQKTPAQVMLRWNIQMGTVPLPKANHSDHLLENIDIFDFELNDDHMARLNNLNEQYSALSDGSLTYV